MQSFIKKISLQQALEKKLLRPVASLILEKEINNSKKFLIVRKSRKNNAWQFPQGGKDDHENFLQASIRELQEECGKNLKIEFLSLDCIGTYKYFFPDDFIKKNQKKFLGADVHFFHAKHISGKIEIDNNEIIDYKWVKFEELKNFFEKDYLSFVENQLIESLHVR